MYELSIIAVNTRNDWLLPLETVCVVDIQNEICEICLKNVRGETM